MFTLSGKNKFPFLFYKLKKNKLKKKQNNKLNKPPKKA